MSILRRNEKGFGRKWHYFDDEHAPRGEGFSLCGKVGLYFGPLEQGNDDSADNCAECKRRKAKLTPPEEA